MNRHTRKRYLLIWFLPLLLASGYFGYRFSLLQSSSNVPREQVLDFLLEGNLRFSGDHPVHPDQTLDRLRELSVGQHPVAAIVSCSDSRVPPELVFDQGLGDLFVIRNAGNIVADYEIGSVEYAIEHLEVPLVIILGHTKCGAIGAFVEHEHEHSHHYSEYVQKIIDFIDAEEEEQVLQRGTVDFYEKAIEANVLHGIHELKSKVPLVSELTAAKKLRVVGAIYDVETGMVRVLEDLD